MAINAKPASIANPRAASKITKPRVTKSYFMVVFGTLIDVMALAITTMNTNSRVV